MKWRLLPAAAEACAARPGAWNMAVDEALAQSVAEGGAPVLRLYTWSPACLSLGRNQPAHGRFDTRLAQRRDIDIVRRPTGGLAVYHHRELTYAIAAPAALLGGPRRAYREINRAIVNGLGRLGVAASIAGFDGVERVPRAPVAPSARCGEGGALGGHAAPHPLTPTLSPRGERGQMYARAPAAIAWREPCFREAARGEIVAAGRKLVGSAQRRERGVILQHGSILIAGDQSPVLELQHLADSRSPPQRAHGRTGSSARETAARSVTLHELLGRCPDLEDIADAIVAGFEDLGGIRFAADSLTRDEQRRASRLSHHYRSDAWTWRR